jgi:hypothetical protein
MSMEVITEHQLEPLDIATYSVEFETTDLWGGYSATWILGVLHSPKTDEIHINIQRGKRDRTLVGIYGKSFANCETQHSDAERWVNEIVGYPNPIAGLFEFGLWRELAK